MSVATPVDSKPSLEPLLVPLSEAARLLGVKIYSVRRLARRGVLPRRVIGNRWLIPYAALKTFAAGKVRS
jgi:excisionase family DNA binding protein